MRYNHLSKIRRVATTATLLFLLTSWGQALHDTALVRKIIDTNAEVLDDLKMSEASLQKEINAALEIYYKDKQYKNLYPTIRIWYTIGTKTQQPNDQIVNTILQTLEKTKIKDRTTIAKCYHLISWLYGNNGQVRMSEYYGVKAQSYYNPKTDSVELGKILSNLCVIHIQSRDYNQAKYLGKISLPYNKEPYFIAAALSNLGLAYIYSHEEIYKGRYYLEKAREIYPEDLKSFYYNMSKSYEAEGDFYCAVIYADSAALVKTEMEYENYFALSQQGICHYHLGNYPKAKYFLKQAYAYNDSIVDVRERAKTNLPLAQTEIKLGNYNQALIYLLEGLTWIKPVAKEKQLKAANINFLPSGDLYYIDYMHELAKTYTGLYKESNLKNEKYQKLSIDYFEKCITFIDKIKLFYESPKAKNDLAKETKDIYTDYIDLISIKKNFNSNPAIVEKIFKLAQQYGAFNLREQLSERLAIEEYVKDKSLISRYYRYKSTYIDHITLANENPASFPEYLDSKNKYESLADSLQKVYPGLKKHFNNIQIVSFHDIQKKLGKEDHFIHYFFGKSQLYIFSISKNKYQLIIKDNAEVIHQKAIEFLQFISDDSRKTLEKGEAKTNAEVSFFLYQNLFQNLFIAPGIKKIIIVPDEILFRIPFEALSYDSGQVEDKKPTYLIQKYAFQYYYFCGQIQSKVKNPGSDELLGFGLEYDRYTLESMKTYVKDSVPVWLDEGFRGETLAPLYFSDDEVKSVANLYDGKIFLNTDALKSNFTRYAADYDLLHVSAHSYVDFERPELSGIIFTKSKNEPDHLLTVSDLVKMNFSAQLVTLSSCNSATGRITSGSGVSSLTKAFIENGSDAVLGSQWSVSDQVTSIFMERFYIHLKDGMEKSAALRAAKLDMLDETSDFVNPAYRNPTYWAAWTLYGDDAPIHTQWPQWLILCGWVVLALLLFALITKYYGRFFSMNNRLLKS